MPTLYLRSATPADADLICQLIYELAEYECAPQECHADPLALYHHLQPDASPRCDGWIAEVEGAVAGFALAYPHYSTWETNWGLYLEDLFVRPPYRGQGVGLALLKQVATTAVERGCVRLEWQVLDWNELALGFYRRIGASAMEEWTKMRLSGDALHALADPAYGG